MGYWIQMIIRILEESCQQFKDKIWNYAGYCFAQFTKKRDLLILNGSVKGDSSGECTHFTKRGGSVIYIAILHSAY